MADRVLFADVGTTFTKTYLLEIENGKWQIKEHSSAPTTVDSPEYDVMAGLQRAITKLETWTDIKLLSKDRPLFAINETKGISRFTATSSAGGGLQVLVAGLTEQITAESGHRAALGAGAIVTEILSLNNAGTDIENLERIRNVPCDIVLITGGTDGGNVADVLALAEFLSLAAPKPRFDSNAKTPLIYAGNIDARPYLENIIGDTMNLICIDNIRPTIETESLQPVRDTIQKIFLEHVMSGAPGFKNLALWTQNKIKPTPVALGTGLTYLAKQYEKDVLAVDLGGATTDVFSVIDGQFYRSVSANVGMSHSIINMLEETSLGEINKWLPWDQNDDFVQNWLLNKAIRPTTLPQVSEELMLEQAFAKQAIKLSLEHHRTVAAGLRGVRISRQIGDIFTQRGAGQTLVNLMSTDAIIGLGGVISNAPRYSQALSILLDGIEPEGITDIFVDTGSFLTFAGIMSTNDNAVTSSAFSELQSPTLIGTCVAPVGPPVKPGTIIARVICDDSSFEIAAGEISVVNPCYLRNSSVLIKPEKEFDVGQGKGNSTVAKVAKSKIGLILDGRGRPIFLPKRSEAHMTSLRKWHKNLATYPEKMLHLKQGG